MPRNYHLILPPLMIFIVGIIASMASGTELCGDANTDGAVNVADAVYIISYLYRDGPVPEPPYAADANNDGTVDVSDALYLVVYTFGGGHRPDCPPVTDIDGNIYHTVTIGSQVWMAENLRVTHYRNGDPIPLITDATAWGNLSSGASCFYNNDPDHLAAYGPLYNYYAVNDSRNIAPEGWHIPTDAEWQTLIDYLGGYTVAGGKMKETGLTHWRSPNAGATNESGFSAFAGGYRRNDGYYAAMGNFAYFWTSTSYGSGNARFRALYYLSAEIHAHYFGNSCGMSIRCIKD